MPSTAERVGHPANPSLHQASNAPTTRAIRSDSQAQQQIDYEGELAIVIGKPASMCRRYAFDYSSAIASPTMFRRDWQREKRSAADSSPGKVLMALPQSDWIVTKVEIADPNKKLKNPQRQKPLRTTTGDMIFDVPTLIESLSSTMTLPGSIILTRRRRAWVCSAAGLDEGGDKVVVEIEKRSAGWKIRSALNERDMEPTISSPALARLH
jgi:2-keto-4-pentenoate hydratase/2-oxohepta-3-ene-1,7-dioic acid hydratase in catechol pathway